MIVTYCIPTVYGNVEAVLQSGTKPNKIYNAGLNVKVICVTVWVCPLIVTGTEVMVS